MVTFLKKLAKCLLCWRTPRATGKVEEAQLIIVQSAPNTSQGKASKTNLVLADLAEEYSKELNIQIFAQAEVNQILESRGVPTLGSVKVYSHIPLFSTEYGVGSMDVAKLHKEFCDQNSYKRVLIIAFCPHAQRVMWIYERLGLEVITPGNLPRLEFQKDLSQWRWRRALTAYPYELLARIYFLYKEFI